MDVSFYHCKRCGNIVEFVHASGIPVMCCGEKMTEIVANASDGATEKHVPVCSQEGNVATVRVGEAEHPMTEAHYIKFIVLKTEQGVQKKVLKPNDKPEAVFVLTEGDKAIEAYAYCNLHSLFKGAF